MINSRIVLLGIFFLVAVFAISFAAGNLVLPSQASEQAKDVIVKDKGDKELVIYIHYRAKPGGVGGGGASCPSKTGYKWPTKDLSFVINPNDDVTDELGNPLTGQQIADAVAAGFAPWEASSGLNPAAVGSTGSLPSSYVTETTNGVNEIAWASLGAKGMSNVIAVTYVWRSRVTRQIIEADMVNNNDPGFDWVVVSGQFGNPNTWIVPATGKYDVANIDTHEFGHFVGIDHVSEPQHTMYTYGSTDEVKKRSLECGDINGVKKLYGS
jgi:hypothetical protein